MYHWLNRFIPILIICCHIYFFGSVWVQILRIAFDYAAICVDYIIKFVVSDGYECVEGLITFNQDF